MQTKSFPDIIYERFNLNELSTSKRIEILKEKGIEKKIKELQKSNTEILKRYPPEIISKSIKTRLNEMRAHNKRITILRFSYSRKFMLIVSTVFVILFGIIIQQKYAAQRIGNIRQNNALTTRIKGLKPYIKIYKKTNSGSLLLGNNSQVKKNDILQISYNSAGDKYGIIFSIDGRKTLSLHYPRAETSSTILKTGMDVPLHYAYKLDNAPYFERFFLITTNSEIKTGKFLNDLKKNLEIISLFNIEDKNFILEIPKSYKQTSVLLKKEKQ